MQILNIKVDKEINFVNLFYGSMLSFLLGRKLTCFVKKIVLNERENEIK